MAGPSGPRSGGLVSWTGLGLVAGPDEFVEATMAGREAGGGS